MPDIGQKNFRESLINREFKDQAYVDVNRDRLLKRPS